MTEIECEISAQTFMSAHLNYITSAPLHWYHTIKSGKNKRDELSEGWVKGKTCTWESGEERNSCGVKEKKAPGGLLNETRCVSRLLSLPASSQDFTTALLFVDMISLMQTEPEPFSFIFIFFIFIRDMFMLCSAGNCSRPKSCTQPKLNHAVFTSSQDTEKKSISHQKIHLGWCFSSIIHHNWAAAVLQRARLAEGFFLQRKSWMLCVGV